MKQENPSLDITEEYDNLLRGMFDSSAVDAKSGITPTEFEDLLIKLDLQDHYSMLKYEMFEFHSRSEISYELFRDGLILFIMNSHSNNNEEAPECREEFVEDGNQDQVWRSNNSIEEPNGYSTTPKRTEKRKYGRRTKPDMDLFTDQENLHPITKTVTTPKMLTKGNLSKSKDMPPTSRYLTPSYTPRKKTVDLEGPILMNAEIFGGEGEDNDWKKLDSEWNDYSNDMGSPVNSEAAEFDPRIALRAKWKAVVGDPEYDSMNKLQLCHLMEGVGVPMSPDSEQLNELFSFLHKNEHGLVSFNDFANEMMAFVSDGLTSTSTPNDKYSTAASSKVSNSNFLNPEEPSPICFDTEISNSNNRKIENSSPNLSAKDLSIDNSSVFLSTTDTSDLCPSTEVTDPSALAAVNNRRRKRAAKASRGKISSRNAKNSSLPSYHPIKRKEAQNSPLAFLLNGKDRYVSVDILKQNWEDSGLENTAEILQALQVPETETSLSIEVLSEAFDLEIEENLSLKAFTSLLKQGIKYYKGLYEASQENNSSTNFATDKAKDSMLLVEKMEEIEKLKHQLQTSEDEMHLFISENNSLKRNRVESDKQIKEVKNLQQKLKASEEQLHRYRSEADNVKDELKNLEHSVEEVEFLKQQLNSSTQCLQSCQEENHKLKSEFEMINNHTATVTCLKEKLDATCKKLEISNQHLQSMTDQNNNLQNQIDKLQKEILIKDTSLNHHYTSMKNLKCAFNKSITALEKLQKENTLQRQRADEIYELYQRHSKREAETCNDLISNLQKYGADFFQEGDVISNTDDVSPTMTSSNVSTFNLFVQAPTSK